MFPIFTDESKFTKNVKQELNKSVNLDYNDSKRYSVKVKSPEAVKPLTKLSPKILSSVPISFLGHKTVKPLNRGFLPSVLTQASTSKQRDRSSEDG